EAELRQLRRAAAERPHVLEPAARALPVLVREAAEPQEVEGESPLPLERLELGIDLTGPVVRRPGGDRPPRPQVQLRAPDEGRLLRHPLIVGRDPLRGDAVEISNLSLAED